MQQTNLNVANDTETRDKQMEEITLHLKIRVPLDSPDGKLLSFLKASRTSATQMVLEAARAYWLPIACAGNVHSERVRAVAHECLRTLQIQERYISTVCELDNSSGAVPTYSQGARPDQDYQAVSGVKHELQPLSFQERKQGVEN